MEFTTGRKIFVALFVVAFVALMVLSYKKDTQTHQKHYKGSFWILVFFIFFVLFLFGLKTFLNF